ncbi:MULTISPECIES: ATP-binding protein [Cyanophyceae]|uniref:ATP-binding protein n=1 Tax=Cyanophyceae TaxID=3028117 RepID=UPI00232AE02C|nr:MULTISPECIES: ATP-binding protein [Cyanophyceae]MDB9357343.1 ATP-binding protein [Nodularia spumigena CS-587/03]MDB9341181.1 ATP-binding protein [Nodularia spumigena CS-589/07]MDB9402371.1 ATP-binding protein [Microcystis aeruginosa CS-567/02-A1]MDB9499367.1 ATP-binding protein [Nodularia spumigena CS-336/02]MDB9532419.1 ATP-binding protein [Nodularia spumigena CS-1038]
MQNTWQERNGEYLAVSLTWLRSRLKLLIQSDNEEDIDKVAKIMAELAEIEPPPALIILSHIFGLSDFERSLLLLCAAMEFATDIAQLCAAAQDNPQRPYPTFALALSCFDHVTWDVVLPNRPLRYWQLLEINQSNTQTLTTSPLRADERIVNYIKGVNYLDDRLATLVLPLNPWSGQNEILPLPPSQQKVASAIIHQINQSIQTPNFPIFQLSGIDTQSKQIITWQICQELELQLYRLPVELLPTQSTELANFARLWQRESRLLPLALYIDVQEVDNKAGSSALRQFLTHNEGIIFLDIRDTGFSLNLATVTFDIAKPTPQEQQQAWELTLENQSGYAAQLANQFHLNFVEIAKIAKTAQHLNDHLTEQLWNDCLASTRPRLDNLAQRLEIKASWSDIVLPSEELDLLHQIADQVRQRSIVYDQWGFRQRMNRGMGVSVMFAGESGTGKTMAAEVIANDLQLNLYRIDLSAVVSKYIGETEKNLRKLFDAAEDGGAILFFDEADALFGKRSEVKDSHDRYANIEINYLLQRLEAYRGLAILATNIKSALDAAFMRRLRFIVNFSFPGVMERKALWEKVFPSETPIEELDFHKLAKYNLTGGNIHNIAVNAAFLAAKAGTPVNMDLLIAATKTEFRKMDKPFI